MQRQRDDSRHASAGQRANAARLAADAGPPTDNSDVTFAVREAICHALVAIYRELHQRGGPSGVPTPPAGNAVLDGHSLTYRPGVGPCVSCVDADGKPTYLPLELWAVECHPDERPAHPGGGPAGRAAHAAAPAGREMLTTQVFPEYMLTTGAGHPTVLHPLYEALLNALFLISRPEQRDDQGPPPSARRPRHVRRAVEAVNAHPERPYSVADLADLAGVKVRTLQQGFRAHLGTSPMGYLRTVRLARAHEDLLRDDTLGIAEVAYRWGFTHLGRFAAVYAQQYGETPSRTRDRRSAG